MNTIKQASVVEESKQIMLESFLDSVKDIVFIKDSDGVYLGCNPAFTDYVGLSRERIVGMTDYDLFDRQTADQFRLYDQRMLELRRPCQNEEWVTYPNGGRRLLDTVKTPFWAPDGSLIGVLGISRDMTERHQAEAALRESEANFRAFFRTIDDLVLVATRAGKIVFCNTACERKLGYTRDELGSLHVLDLHHAACRDEAAVILQAMLQGERETCPLPLATKGGDILPVETRVWFGQWGGADCIFGVSKDLSAEQEAEQRFERLFRSNPCPMALSSLPERRFIDVNDSFLREFGYSRDQVIGSTAAALGLFVDIEQHTQIAERLMATGHASDLELRARSRDGAIREGLFSAEVIENQGKRYLLTVMLDITARKLAEAEVARLSQIQRELMHLATDLMNIPHARQDEAINESLAAIGRLIHADRAYLFAYHFDTDVMSNTHEWCNDGISAEIGNLQDVPNALFPEWVEDHRNGRLIHIPCVLQLSPNDNLRRMLEPQGIQSLIALPLMQGSTCLGYVGFDAVREAREWKADAVALLRVLAELFANFQARRAAELRNQKLQQSLAEARDLAQEAVIAKTLFLANMSHEIRTPLNAILGYAQIMARDCCECQKAQHLPALKKSAEHLLELLNDLLDLARSDGKQLTVVQADVDLRRTVEDVRIILAQRLEAQALSLDVWCAPDLPAVICGDQRKIRQILINLVGNAVKFTVTGGIRIRVSRSAGSVQDAGLITVDVEDTGCGIPATDTERIFDLFAQVENGQKVEKGTGLGLPLSRRYARAMGGDITVSSTPGTGSRFRFTFRACHGAKDGLSGAQERGRGGHLDESSAAADEALAAMACVPVAQLLLLNQAIRRGDIRLLRSSVEEIAHEHAALADRLRPYVAAYDYDGIRRLVMRAQGCPT
jgi:PAS domain S-box-containing protein